MVALHTGLLLACVAEVVFAGRPFIPWLGWPMLALAVLCQFGRAWVIHSLGHQWTTRIIVVPGAERVRGRGLYRLLPRIELRDRRRRGHRDPAHPTAWITAIAFTVAERDPAPAGFRIPAEDRALKQLT